MFRPVHVMTKPIGAICNLDCTYCYYLEKEKMYPGTRDFRMSPETLETFIRQFIDQTPGPEIAFAWQGGEPTLLGVEFFERAIALQKKFCPPGKRVTNALQTNGTRLDKDWCRLFRENQFLIGLSLDGPQEIHDAYRVDKGGKPTWSRVMAGLEWLKSEGVEFNTLTVVNSLTSQHPREIYKFLRRHGSGFMQFIPIIERVGQGTLLAPPPDLTPEAEARVEYPVTEWSVRPGAYGRFLCSIFDEWIQRDVGKVFVQIFDVMLGIWAGRGASLCVFMETCGSALAMEHNGDLFSCDHYVYPEFKLGNIHQRSIAELANSPRQRDFGLAKRETLPKFCRECEVRFACNGECPKHRFLKTPDGEPGLNYLCAGYKKFLNHIDEPMKEMARLLATGRPASDIMKRRKKR